MPVRLSSSSRLLPRLFAALMIGTALAGAPAALAPAAAQTVSVDNLSFGPKEMAATIPRIDVEGSSLTQGELASLFQFRDIQSIASTLGRLNARSLRIPEIRIEQSLPAADGKTTRQTTIYRDLTMSDIVAGKARQVAVAGGSILMEDAIIGKIDGSFGRMSIDEVDFTGVVRFMIDKAVGGEPAKTLYRNGVFDGMTMKGEKFSLSLGRMAFGEFRARPMKQPLMSVFELVKEMEATKASGAPPDPKATRKMLDFVMDMFDAFETTPLTIENVRVDAQDDKKRPVTVSMAKATMGAMGKLRYPSLQFENIDIKAADGSVRLGGFTFKGIDLAPTAAGLREAGDQPLEQWAAVNWRKLIPSFDGFAMSGANIDVPDEKKPGQRIKASLGDYDLTLTAYVQGIPTNISTRLRNFVFEIPANTNESGLKDLLALGYKALDMSGALTAKWNENDKVINFENVSALGAGMGAIAIKGTIGNAIKELFTGDPTMMQIAAMGLTAKDIEVKVDNAGLFEKLIAREAQKQRKKPEDLRRDLGAMANIMIPGVLGGGTAAQTVANAVSAFMAKPGSLVLGVKAKDPAGISVGEAAMASGNPLSLLPKVDISARAN